MKVAQNFPPIETETLNHTETTCAVYQSMRMHQTMTDCGRLSHEAEVQSKLQAKDLRATAAKTGLLKQKFVLCFVGAPILVGVALGVWSHSFVPLLLGQPQHAWAVWGIVTAATLLPLALACVVSTYYINKHSILTTWWLSRVAAQVGKKAVAAPASLAITAIYQGGIWDLVKSLVGWQ